MLGSGKSYLFAVILILGIAIPIIIPAEKKALTRVDDPVVVECKDFTPLFKSPINQLALMALHGDTWAPVPFQIDQKKPDGQYAFDIGSQASEDPDPNLDSNDELVFMVKDTGDRAGSGKWPEGAVSGVEIEITDPKDGAEGWVYLLRFSGKAPRSEEDYIRLEVDEAGKYRKVISYEYALGGPADRVYPDYGATIKPGGGFGRDVIDRLKIRGEAILIGGISVPFNFDEWTRAKDMGYIDGPVRVLHFAEGYLELKYINYKIKGEGYSIISYYVNHMIWPMKMEIPFDKVPLLRRVHTIGYMDFCPTVYGSYSFSAANPLNKQVIFDGHMSKEEKNLDTETEIDWIAGFGPEGAIVNRLFFVPRKGIKLLPYYLDDETVNDNPEDCPGVSSVGYDIVGFENLSSPTPIAYQYYYFLSELEPRDLHRILDILDHPVKVEIKAVAGF